MSHVLEALMNPISEEFTRLIGLDNEAVVRGFMNLSLDDRHFYQFAKYFIKMQLYVYEYEAHPNRMVKSFWVIPLDNYHILPLGQRRLQKRTTNDSILKSREMLK